MSRQIKIFVNLKGLSKGRWRHVDWPSLRGGPDFGDSVACHGPHLEHDLHDSFPFEKNLILSLLVMETSRAPCGDPKKYVNTIVWGTYGHDSLNESHESWGEGPHAWFLGSLWGYPCAIWAHKGHLTRYPSNSLASAKALPMLPWAHPGPQAHRSTAVGSHFCHTGLLWGTSSAWDPTGFAGN